MVKPSGEGSSVGVYKLKGASVEEIREALAQALRFDDKVLVEERWFGRELTIAVLGGKALPIIEIRAPEGNYDYQNKYFGDVVKYECPAQLDEAVTQNVLSACEAAFAAIGARGWGRIDAMLREDGSFILLEFNSSPGMTPHSSCRWPREPWAWIIRSFACGLPHTPSSTARRAAELRRSVREACPIACPRKRPDCGACGAGISDLDRRAFSFSGHQDH